MFLKSLIFSFISLSIAEEPPCNPQSTVDITSSEVLANNSVIHGGIEYSPGQWFDETQEDNVTVIRRGCICMIKDCLWKCCPEGAAHFGRPCEASSDPAVSPFSPPVYLGVSLVEGLEAKNHFKYFYGNPCPNHDRYTLDPDKSENKFYLQQDGALYQPSASLNKQHHPEAWFCLDLFERSPLNASESWTPRTMAVVCFYEDPEPPAQALYGVYAVGLLISVPFMLATLAVYAFLPELRNLHGRCLMAYVSGLVVSFSLLAYLQLNSDSVKTSMTGCYVIAFAIFFCFMSSFFWLNVMCFDIWRTFSCYGGKSTSAARERRRFAWYAAYAWGMALVLTGVTALMEFHSDLADYHIKPNFGANKCWFSDRSGELVYFYVPVFVLVVVNSTLFAVTAHSILRIRNETAILRGSESAKTGQYERDRQRFVLYLKLFVVMGVNWTLEVISFFIKGSDWVWLVSDITNCALGIIIFVIFVWKNKVRNLIVKRFRRLRHGPEPAPSSNWTNTTVSDDLQLRAAKPE